VPFDPAAEHLEWLAHHLRFVSRPLRRRFRFAGSLSVGIAGSRFNRGGYAGRGSCAGVAKGNRRSVNSTNFNRNVSVGSGDFYGRLL
jgi:hypothetical protein